jgi:hypothetical protein
MAKKRLDLSKPIDVPVSPAGAPTRTNGFIRAAQDTSPQRFRSTGAALREQFRMLMAQAKDRASGLPERDQPRVLNRPLEMGGVVPVTIDPSKVSQTNIYQWSDRTPNLNLNKRLKQHLIDSDYVATKASTGHYANLAKSEIIYKNGSPTISDLGNHFLRVHAGDHQAEVNRLSDLIDKNDPQTIMEHAAAAGVQVFHDTTSIGSHRLRVLVAPGVYEKGEAKRFTNDASTPITARQDVNRLPEAARYEKKKN